MSVFLRMLIKRFIFLFATLYLLILFLILQPIFSLFDWSDKEEKWRSYKKYNAQLDEIIYNSDQKYSRPDRWAEIDDRYTKHKYLISFSDDNLQIFKEQITVQYDSTKSASDFEVGDIIVVYKDTAAKNSTVCEVAYRNRKSADRTSVWSIIISLFFGGTFVFLGVKLYKYINTKS